MALSIPKPATQGEADSKKARASAAIEAPVNDDKEYGTKSGTLTLVNTLANPADPDTVTKMVNDEKQTTVYDRIVGYRLVSSENIVIPDCGIPSKLKSNRMDFADHKGTRKVKAGETFDLTPFELALLLARDEYNGEITGGNLQFVMNYTTKGMRKKDGEIEKIENVVPKASLRAVNGSIHDVEKIVIGESEERQTKHGNTMRRLTVFPEFEKWGSLAVRGARSGGARGTTKRTGLRNEGAAQFLQIVNGLQK